MNDPGLPPGTETAGRIAALISKHFDLIPDQIDGDFIAEEVIDSADFIELFLLLETEFGIEIRAEDLVLDNFRSCHAIAAFVRAKRSPTS